jgi:cell division protein FtsW (lipid II flippase)
VAARRRTTARSLATPTRQASLGLDGALVTSATLLASLGVVMNYSTTAAQAIGEPIPPLALRHALGLLFAGACALVAARLPLVFWARLSLPAWILSMGLLAFTPLVGACPSPCSPPSRRACSRCWPWRRCSPPAASAGVRGLAC